MTLSRPWSLLIVCVVALLSLGSARSGDPTALERWVNRLFAGQEAPGGGVDVDNSGYPIERSACLTVSVGPSAAAECGNLRIVHALPSIRTFNTDKVPTLIYNSEFAHPYPLVAAKVTQTATATTPDSVQLKFWLKVGAAFQLRDSSRWAGSEWPGGVASVRRVTHGYDGINDTKGYYEYQIELANIYGATVKAAPPQTGIMPIVNRKNSRFGAGWWLAGYEQLIGPGSTKPVIVWIGGDGSARQFLKHWSIPNLWYTSQYERSDTLYYNSGVPSMPWTKTDAEGVRTKFDAFGKHLQTIDRLGRVTTFGYSAAGDTLKTITLPPANRVYTLTYTSGRLSSVAAPRLQGTNRITQITDSAGLITSIQNAGDSAVKFRYLSAAADQNLIRARASRVGTTDSFSYDSQRRLASSRVVMKTPTPDLVWTLTAGETRGLAKVGSPSSADTAKVYTKVDGPQTGSADTTVFFQSRFGPTRRLIDALSNQTLVQHQMCYAPYTPACGWLPVRIGNAAGRVIKVAYNAHGKPTSVVDSVTSVGGQQDTTRYKWDATFNQLLGVVPPAKDSTVLSVDAATGNRLWQQPGADSSRRVQFSYYSAGSAAGMVRATVLPGPIRDSVVYDTLGNTSGIKTPLGQWTRFQRDSIGRDTVITYDLTIGGAVKRADTTTFSLRGDVLTTKSSAPALNGASAQSARTTSTYDASGNRLTLQRWSVPDTTGIGTITTTWRYDTAGRRVAEQAADGRVDSTVYDPASNVAAIINRRGLRLGYKYDLLNRKVADTIPAASYPSSTAGIAARAGQPAYQYSVSGDTVTYSYDAIGNLATAYNRDAKIKRSYDVKGLLTSDSSWIRDVSGGGFANHAYGIRNVYDRDGRRTTLRIPTQLGNAGADSLRFGYDAVLGVRTTVTDLLGNQVRLVYNKLMDVDSVVYPGSISRRMTYDADGRLAADTIRNTGTTVYPRHPAALLRATRYDYDARGLVIASWDATAFLDTLFTSYSGLGHLIKSQLTQWGTWLGSGWPARYKSIDTLRYDALGNIKFALKVDTTFGQAGAVIRTSSHPASAPSYVASTGRMAQDNASTGGTRAFTYDSAGNNRFSSITAGVSNPMEDRAMYYRADGRLAATDWRSVAGQTVPAKPEKRQLTEIRYDALGRKVLELAQPPNPVNDCNLTALQSDGEALQCHLVYVRRYVWDGNDELVEIQMPLSAVSPGAPTENDTLVVQASRINHAGHTIDPTPFYGRVVYIPGLAVDQPLAIVRLGYADWPTPSGSFNSTWGPHTKYPFWDARGTARDGVFGDGSRFKCQPANSTANCVKLYWPIEWSAYQHQRRNVYAQGWDGSVLDDKSDKSFLNYRRNRYYDAITGRFTQEDPIGLAGGLNLYGFANGDPVNFSDPFGLCPVCAVYAIFEIGSSLYDAYDLSKTAIAYARGRASKAELAVTAAGAAAGIWTVGGGLGRAGRAGVKTAVNFHHPWPKYLGGAQQQILEVLPTGLHKAYHSGLDKILPRQVGGKFYENLSGDELKQIYRDFEAYTRAFDAEHGTRLWDAARREGFPR